jgi:hypothetical protein
MSRYEVDRPQMSDRTWARLIAMAGIGVMLCGLVAATTLGSYNVELALFDTTAAAMPMICATVGFGLVVLCRFVFEVLRDVRSQRSRLHAPAPDGTASTLPQPEIVN